VPSDSGRRRRLFVASRRRLRGTLIASALIAGWGGALWLLWGGMARRLASGEGSRCLKDFYLADQFSVMAIARNVADGGDAYVEPFTETGSSVYPSGYYWLMGHAARLSGESIIAAWNYLGLLSSVALLGVCIAWARWARPGTLAWLLAPLAFVVGTMQWWVDGGWSAGTPGNVMWPTFASLYSPGSQNPALFVAAAALLALAAALVQPGRERLALAAAAGAATGLTLHLHAYVAVFAVVTMTILLLGDQLLVEPNRRWRWASLGATGAAVGAAAQFSDAFAPPVVAAAATVLGLILLRPAWRSRTGPQAVCWAVAALVVAAPLLRRIVAEVVDPDSFFHLRASSVAGAAVEPAVATFAFLYAPLWLLMAAALFQLARGAATDARERVWAAAMAGVAAAMLVLTFSDRLSIEGLEGYRFVPYGTFLGVALASPWLWTTLTRREPMPRGLGAGIAGALVLTLPTTSAFASSEHERVRCYPDEEVAAYRAIADVVSPGEMVLLDRCFAAYEFKVHSGLRVINVNPGLAVPDAFEAVKELGEVVQTLDTTVPGDDIATEPLPLDLVRSAGATRFLTHTACGGLDRRLISARFGQPLVRLRLEHAPMFGLPEPTFFELYRVPGRPPPRPAGSVPAMRPANRGDDAQHR
jgi:hypothetical protein